MPEKSISKNKKMGEELCINDSSDKLGIMFFDDNVPADIAEKINNKAEELFYNAQTTLCDYIKSLGYKCSMGVIYKQRNKRR